MDTPLPVSSQLYACSEFHLQPAHVGYEGATSIAASLQLGAMPRLEQLTLSSNNLVSQLAVELRRRSMPTYIPPPLSFGQLR